MSTEEVIMYRIVCDWPACGASAQDESDYYAWADASHAASEALDGDWRQGREGTGTHFCPDHVVAWASDHENGEPFPQPPYLLIHDGDTDTSADDGRVTLIVREGASDGE